MVGQVNHIVLRSAHEYDLLIAWQHDYSSHLKQQALLFDQIGILRLENLRQVMSSTMNLKDDKTDLINSKLQAFISETEWLEENGVVFEPKFDDEVIETFTKK